MIPGEVDPFIGCEPCDFEPDGLAAAWWWPKPPIGNTHPGATSPFGMVSVCPTSGGYPTGYGRYDRSTEGPPARLHDDVSTTGVTHFHHSGTGAIRKYYNYLRVTPLVEPLDELGRRWVIADEQASPGWYRAVLDNGIVIEVTAGPRSAVHRYTFPEAATARLVLDCSYGGIEVDQGTTVPLRADVHTVDAAGAAGTVMMEGVPVSFHAVCDQPEWRSMPWYDRRLMHGGSQLRFDSIRPTTLRPFGVVWMGRVEAGASVELRLGLSLRGVEQAARNLRDDAPETPTFDRRRDATERSWQDHLGRIRVDGGTADQRTVFASALYRSLIKPCMAAGESPFWESDGPFAFDLATMWDLYRTHLPLVGALFPERAVELANALVRICEEEGNFPIGYRMARGADRFARQGSALAHTFLADVAAVGRPGVDWDWALSLMSSDLTRLWGEEYLEHGVAHPVTHTLDLGLGYHCTAAVARQLGDDAFADRLAALSARWVNAYDDTTGLVIDSRYYEGGRWNYSFRLLHDMARRIEIAGGDDAFVALLDRFFGVGEDPVKQLGVDPEPSEVAAGLALDRFEGLNNEPDMDAPWCYHHAGRPDRTAEIVRHAVDQQFHAGRGGLPGNDDSGGLSSWYVWAAVGLFPQAGQASMLIGPPSFGAVEFDLEGGRTFAISTRGMDPCPAGAVTRPQAYVVGARLDGRELDRAWLHLHEFHAGGHLELDLADVPGTWGTTERPPSVSPHQLSTHPSPRKDTT